jgi:hypothetical protein
MPLAIKASGGLICRANPEPQALRENVVKPEDFRQLKPGDKIRIVDNTCGHNYEIGTVVEVFRNTGTSICARRNDGQIGNNLSLLDVAPRPSGKTVEDYRRELDALSAKVVEINDRLACMEVLGVDMLDENEYIVWKSLDTLESDAPRREKVKIISELLGR